MSKEITQAPAPPNGQVTIDLPAGMTEEQFKTLFATFDRNVVKGKKIGKADGKAIRRLMTAHKPELLQYRREEWKAVGLDPSKLTIRT